MRQALRCSRRWSVIVIVPVGSVDSIADLTPSCALVALDGIGEPDDGPGDPVDLDPRECDLEFELAQG